MLCLSADVGGTFTDLVLLDSQTETLHVDKILSTPGSTESITRGIARILSQAGAGPDDLGLFVHGFTIATNAWLTRSGARLALVVTEGFADVLEIGAQRRPKLYSLTSRREPPLVPRSQVVEVAERVDAFGGAVRPLTAEDARAAADRVAALAPDAVAISLVFGYLNMHHEEMLREAIAARLPGVPIYAASGINPQAEEYPRTNTAVTAAYVGPVVDRYLGALEADLPAKGIHAPLLLMRSDGGVATPRAARDNPGHMLLSGPAGGVIAGVALGRQLAVPNLITFDMGGTSADFSLIADGEARMATERTLGREILRLPSIDIETISAGGGSIGRVDLGGAIRVGPDSAGAAPGPACYGRGGAKPTLTDAALVLGILNAADYLGGEMSLDTDKARQAIERDVAAPLGLATEDAAFGMMTIANAQMAQAIRSLSIERGHDLRRFALLSFGGAGSMFAPFLARDLEMTEVLVPLCPGVFAAFGLLLSDMRHTAQKQFLRPLSQTDAIELRATLETMATALDAALARDGISARDRLFRYAADVRCVGQFHELTIPLPALDQACRTDLGRIAADFHKAHERAYGHADASVPCEIVNLRVEAIGLMPKPGFPPLAASAAGAAAPIGRRPVYLGQGAGWHDFALYRRDGQRPGDRVDGPAILTQRDTTVVILPGQTGVTTAEGVLRIAAQGE